MYIDYIRFKSQEIVYRNVGVDESLISLCKHQVYKDHHILQGGKCSSELRCVPDHHGEVHHGADVSLTLVLC